MKDIQSTSSIHRASFSTAQASSPYLVDKDTAHGSAQTNIYTDTINDQELCKNKSPEDQAILTPSPSLSLRFLHRFGTTDCGKTVRADYSGAKVVGQLVQRVEASARVLILEKEDAIKVKPVFLHRVWSGGRG